MALETFANTPTPSAPSTPWTLLDADINAVVTTLDVASAVAFPSSGQYRILIGSEYLLVTAGAGTITWTVTRGVEGSTAASHTAGAPIYGVLTAAALTRWPRSMTTLGDVEYLGASGTPTRLGAPSDGDYALRFTTGVPSYVAAGGGSPGGLTTQVQFNDSGAFGGSANLTWDGTQLAVAQLDVAGNVAIGDVAVSAVEGLRIHRTLSSVSAVNWGFTAGTLYTVPSGTVTHNQAAFESSVYIDASSAADYTGNLYGGYAWAEHDGSGDVSVLVGMYSFAYNFGDNSNVNRCVGFYTDAYADNTSTTGELIGGYTKLHFVGASATTTSYGWYIATPEKGGTATVTTHYGAYVANQVGVGTNNYYFWADSRGVYRIRDDALDGAGNEQAIPALYNPRFTKYVAGAADYERGVQQWVANVYQMGAEVGGTGTNRAVAIIGSSLAIPAASGTWNLASATLTLPTSQTITTPTIASFANATHAHTNAAGGGQLAEGALALTDITTNNATASAHGLLPKLSGNAAQFLTGTGTWATPAGAGDALTTNPLSQFAATTSLQLLGVISDETGSGALVFATSPTIVTPTIAKVANLTGNGFVKTSGGDGTLSIDTATYITTTTGVIGITIDGGGVAITTGVKGFIAVEKACTIVGWRLLSTDAGATAGAIVIDVWKDTYANYPPTVADTIAASAKPTLSGVNKNVDTTLTGWGTSLAAGDILGFNVDSATTVTKVLLELKVTATA